MPPRKLSRQADSSKLEIRVASNLTAHSSLRGTLHLNGHDTEKQLHAPEIYPDRAGNPISAPRPAGRQYVICACCANAIVEEIRPESPATVSEMIAMRS